MRNKYLILFLSVIIFIGTIQIAHGATASMFTRYFAGKITSAPKASDIITAEASGFICTIPGTTFDIKPIGNSPKGPYLIQGGVSSKSGGAPVVGRLILGKYRLFTTQIECMNVGDGEIKMISAYNINLYATSKR